MQTLCQKILWYLEIYCFLNERHRGGTVLQRRFQMGTGVLGNTLKKLPNWTFFLREPWPKLSGHFSWKTRCFWLVMQTWVLDSSSDVSYFLSVHAPCLSDFFPDSYENMQMGNRRTQLMLSLHAHGCDLYLATSAILVSASFPLPHFFTDFPHAYLVKNIKGIFLNKYPCIVGQETPPGLVCLLCWCLLVSFPFLVGDQ